MAEKIFTVPEAAEHLRYKVHTIRKYLQKGIIKGVKVGNEWRIPDSDLQAYIDGLKAKRDGRE
ncbi:MAG: helix-turn-helix domain-containing protein [Candidatus Xenobiia bacterium LiM19]